MKTIFKLLAISFLLLFISCDFIPLLQYETPVSSIEISGVRELEEGDSTTLSVEIQPSSADNQDVTWTSSDESVATVDSDAQVTAQSAGTVTIFATATDDSGVSDDFEMTIKEASSGEPVSITSIEISGVNELEEDSSTTLSVEIQPSDANETLVWTSSDEDVATVNSNGRVTANSTGSVIITATAQENNVSDDFVITVTETVPTDAIIADHSIMRMIYDAEVPASAIEAAKSSLKIGYGHTSHGGQITSGMTGLIDFVNDNNDSGERFAAYDDNLFSWSRDGGDGVLQLFEGSGYDSGDLELDCGTSGWDDETREFLGVPYSSDYNVIMWSWCGELSYISIDDVDDYLSRMETLETEYQEVVFIYMTGHLDGGSGDPDTSTLAANNQRIRDYCINNNKILFDFADIEKYNLDGDYFGDKYADDGCNYSDGNWASEWQNNENNEEGVDWYSCDSAHSQPVNANQKAYAIWWLWARLAGWDGSAD